MKFVTIPVLVLALAACVAAPVHPGDVAARPVDAPEATVERTTSSELVSKINGEAYRIKVFLPAAKAPDAGFPVVYVLDGNILFGTFAGAVRNESQARDIKPAIVVGIESGEGKLSAGRTYDFTYADLTDYEKSIIVDLGDHPRFGGYEKFRRVIEEEVKPMVEKMARVDRTRQAIFGWSLGGQFVIHTMLKFPESFSAYVAVSPALWRSNRSVFGELEGLQRGATEGNLPFLFIGVGGEEGEYTSALSKWPVDQTKFAAEVKYARMVENVRDFASDVSPYFKKTPQRLQMRIFEGDTHNTVPWSALNPVLRFLLADPSGALASP
ncbi:putative alpha/beta superfamily hydrolase [Luteibacter sp. HA06]